MLHGLHYIETKTKDERSLVEQKYWFRETNLLLFCSENHVRDIALI